MKDENLNQETTTNNNQIDAIDILNQEFFDIFKTQKKISDKKKKISDLITFLQYNPNYLTNPQNKQKISYLYEIILSNLIENNNNFVKSQIDLIEILNKKLYKETDFQKFYKQALPKLFDKFYLQNQNIDSSLISMFNNSIYYNTLTIQDYYPLIENISLEDDNEYRIIALNFLNDQINLNKEITLDKMPKNMLDILTKLSNDNDTQISDLSFKLIETLNNRNITYNQEEENNANVNKYVR